MLYYIYKYYLYKDSPDHIEFIKMGTRRDLFQLISSEPCKAPYSRLWVEDDVTFEDFGSYSMYYIYSENELTEEWKKSH